jgi:hypothetical protein
MEALISIVGVVVGGVITILTAILIEKLRAPKLTLSIESPTCDMTYPPGKPAGAARYLRLKLSNEPLSPLARWMMRSAALQCRAEITFHHVSDGQDIFGHAMSVRWSNSPQPIASQIIDNTGMVRYQILDFGRTLAVSRIDVYPGEAQLFDVAARFDDETECYGWNDESYAHNWRNPQWKLPQGRYLVRAVVTSSGQRCVGIFRLLSELSRPEFRLEPPRAEDVGRLQE